MQYSTQVFKLLIQADVSCKLCFISMFFFCCEVNYLIAPDKAAFCVFTQLLGPKNAIKLFSVRTKTQ